MLGIWKKTRYRVQKAGNTKQVCGSQTNLPNELSAETSVESPVSFFPEDRVQSLEEPAVPGVLLTKPSPGYFVRVSQATGHRFADGARHHVIHRLVGYAALRVRLSQPLQGRFQILV